ncbi:MAG: hypothetical protein WC479_05980 [Candidatus Izemoplasmatales bacterium]
MQTEFETAIARLENVKKVKDGFVARCPAHHDIHQSLSIKDENGKALLYCFAGCKYEDIIKMLDLRLNHENETPVISTTYDYTNEDGKLIYQVVRYMPKNFRQRRPDGNGGWIWDLKGVQPILYHLPEVLKAVNDGISIFCVEGEKDVETLRAQGIIATTISGGSSSQWLPQHVSYLYHARVAIIPDNDTPGKQYATRIANQLYGWCSSLKILALPVKVKGDVTDYLSDHDVQSLINIYDNTPEYTPIGAVTRDEFNAIKGHLIYLHSLWLKSSTNKNNKYNNYIL